MFFSLYFGKQLFLGEKLLCIFKSAIIIVISSIVMRRGATRILLREGGLENGKFL